MSTPYQPDPNQGQGSPYQPTQYTPQYGQSAQPPQYGQVPQYSQNPQGQQGGQPQWGQPQGGQTPPYGQGQQYGQAPQYGQGAYGAMPNFSNVQRSPYLSAAPVGFGEAITEGFKNAFVYEGRASRSACWYWVLGYAIVDIVAGAINRAAGNTALSSLVGLVMFGLAIVGLSVAARRLHDTDKSAFWLFLILLPVIGWIWLWVLYCQPGTPGPNQYGNRV